MCLVAKPRTTANMFLWFLICLPAFPKEMAPKSLSSEIETTEFFKEPMKGPVGLDTVTDTPPPKRRIE